ncbi:MAG: hypothetical protein ACRCW9_06115 [Cetobacterium sp.]
MLIMSYFLISMLFSIQLLLYWQAQLINSSETVKIERVVKYCYSPFYMFKGYLIITFIIGVIICILTNNFYKIMVIFSINTTVLGLAGIIYEEKLINKFYKSFFKSFIVYMNHSKKYNYSMTNVNFKNKEVNFVLSESMNLKQKFELRIKDSTIYFLTNGRQEELKIKRIKNGKNIIFDLSDLIKITKAINKIHIIQKTKNLRNNYEIYKLYNNNIDIFRNF